MFIDNFKKYEKVASNTVKAGAPKLWNFSFNKWLLVSVIDINLINI